jgi:hypothetical protein
MSRPRGACLLSDARILRHVIARIRRNWPRVEITVRGDGHNGIPQVMEFLESLDYGDVLASPTMPNQARSVDKERTHQGKACEGRTPMPILAGGKKI